MKIRKKHLIATICLFAAAAFPQSVDFRGQLSGWGNASRPQTSWQTGAGIRYLPELSFTQPVSETVFWSFLSGGNGFVRIGSNIQPELKLKLYRLQARLATTQSETRIGLQKITFGPAQLLRSLQWFDGIDPKDPLRLTSGVYALRYHYTFLNNNNLWLWSLYGNSKRRSKDLFASVRTRPEWGGRFQLELPQGSLAFSSHFRKTDASYFTYDETRYGLDGRWDGFIGLWAEAALVQNSHAQRLPKWQKWFTVGGDYTFDLGNGLYVLGEHQNISSDSRLMNLKDQTNTSALMFSYPLNLLDSFRLIAYYSWNTKSFYQFYSWQRTYDALLVDVSLFSFPKTGNPALGAYAGYGARIMLVFNH